MTPPQITVRERTPRHGNRDPTYRAEVAQALGPLTIGQPLSGRYQDLHATPWRLEWHEDSGLHLYRQQGDTWVEHLPATPLPALLDGCRHISLAFDQAARHVLAWEDAGQVWVRQWDPATQAYVMRGPWPGCDPLLLMDTTVQYEVSISDTTLLYLSADRAHVLARHQRDQYATAVTLLSGLTRAVLDQVTAHPYRWQLLGESNAQRLVVHSGLYDVTVRTHLSGAAGAVQGGAYVYSRLQESATLTAGAVQAAGYALAVTQYTLPPDALHSAATGPGGGAYVNAAPLVVTPPALLLTAAAGALPAAQYVLVVVTYAEPPTHLTGSAGPPQGGTYA